MPNGAILEGLTFDDLLLVPALSEVLPAEVDVSTHLTPTIPLNIPIVSAAMDTVTEAEMAIAFARQGGLGVIHRNLSVEIQAAEVRKVKKTSSGLIINPITVAPDTPIAEVIRLMREKNISGIPVVDQANKVVGIITNRDVRHVTNFNQRTEEIMTVEVITARENISPEKYQEILHKHRIEKLPVVDESGCLLGLRTYRDIQNLSSYPRACRDANGRLLVGAAIGTAPNTLERAAALLEAGADLLVIDSAHGHSRNVLDVLARIKQAFPACPVIAGNAATAEGAEALMDAGADAVKVGVGPGSICTTRVVAGVGVPQATAIMNCVRVCELREIPVIADGGIKYSGDITKALALGASAVMIGSLFAGADESPGEKFSVQGRSYKGYRGMGSLAALKGAGGDRYQLNGQEEPVAQGIEGMVPASGPIKDTLYQLVGGLRAGMGYVGARRLSELAAKAKFIRVTPAGQREGHVHDVIIIKEAPNYRGLQPS